MLNRISKETVRSFSARLLLFVLPLALLTVLVGLASSATDAQAAETDDYIIEVYTEQEDQGEVSTKDPMPAEYCTPVDVCVESELDPVQLPADGAAAQAMAAFYEKTGVQPYVIVTDDLNTPASEEAADDPVYYYLNDKYLRLFGMDEGHYLLVILLNETGGFDVLSRAGVEASYYVMDDDAIAALEDCIKNTCDPEDLDNSLAEAFTQAATEVMQYPYSDDFYTYDEDGYWKADGEYVAGQDYSYDSFLSDDDDFLFVFWAMISPLMIFVALMIRKAKNEKEAQNKNAQNGTAFEHRTKDYLPEFKTAATENMPLKKANYPITCPGCGATAYPNDDGTCQYCGRAIFDPRA